MKSVWHRRLWNIGAALLAISFAALGLAAVLALAGDAAGTHFATGVASVTGFAFVADLLALVGFVTLADGSRAVDRPS